MRVLEEEQQHAEHGENRAEQRSLIALEFLHLHFFQSNQSRQVKTNMPASVPTARMRLSTTNPRQPYCTPER